MKNKLIKWIYSAKETNPFFVNIRNTLQFIFHCPHDWEHRADVGEEEHGVNPYKRYCKISELKNGYKVKINP